jgi:hypothetical protein
MNLQTRPARFLRWLHGDQAGWAEIVAGEPFTDKPDKLDLVMSTRRWRGISTPSGPICTMPLRLNDGPRWLNLSEPRGDRVRPAPSTAVYEYQW